MEDKSGMAKRISIKSVGVIGIIFACVISHYKGKTKRWEVTK